MSVSHVIVMGGGCTGAATAHDLALRGLHVTVIERGEVASGTTGRNHCLLHSGARYCVTDQESAIECVEENTILRNIMPDLLELNDGLFVAVREEDLAFKERFLEGCAACHIPAHDIPVKHALEMEPFLNPKTLATVQIPDGVFEPFRFCLAFLATARLNGAVVRTYTEVEELICSGKIVTGLKAKDFRTCKCATPGARARMSQSGAAACEVSRPFGCFDHAFDGVDGFVTISGGKTTTARAMAERVVDMVCKKLGIAAACRTRDVPLASYRLFYQ